MLNTIAIKNYRSIRELIFPLTSLNVVTGGDGAGKSNLYRALRLLAETAVGRQCHPLWKRGLVLVFGQGPKRWLGARPSCGGQARRSSVSLQLGFSADEGGYLLDLVYRNPFPNAIRS